MINTSKENSFKIIISVYSVPSRRETFDDPYQNDNRGLQARVQEEVAAGRKAKISEK